MGDCKAARKLATPHTPFLRLHLYCLDGCRVFRRDGRSSNAARLARVHCTLPKGRFEPTECLTNQGSNLSASGLRRGSRSRRDSQHLLEDDLIPIISDRGRPAALCVIGMSSQSTFQRKVPGPVPMGMPGPCRRNVEPKKLVLHERSSSSCSNVQG